MPDCDDISSFQSWIRDFFDYFHLWIISGYDGTRPIDFLRSAMELLHIEKANHHNDFTPFTIL